MELSIFLAKALGLYLVIISLAVWINRNKYPSLVNGVFQNESLLMVMGFDVLILGILLVLAHNVWVYAWQVVITILAWIIFIKGIIIIAFPHLSKKMAKSCLKSKEHFYLSTGINLVIGLFLCYYGFFS